MIELYLGPSSERKKNSFLSDEGPMLETLDFTFHVGFIFRVKTGRFRSDVDFRIFL